MSEKTAYNGQAYTWSLMTYASIDEIERLKLNCRHWAMCLHDKDYDENGEQIEPHVHILCTFEKNISLSAIKKILNSKQNTMGECRRKCGNDWLPLNIPQLYDYLIHKGYDDKYQYDESERTVDSYEYWKRYDRDAKPVDNEFFVDLLSTYESEKHFAYEMGKKYGRDFIKNYKSYLDYRNILVTAQPKAEENYNENLCNKEDFGEER